MAPRSAGPTSDSESEVPGPVGVGRVGEEQPHPVAPQGLDAGQVGAPAVERRLVDLEVARVVDDALRRGDGERAGVGDGVGHRDELGARRGSRRPGRTTSPARTSRRSARTPGLLEPRPEQRQREPRPVDRHRDVAQQERQRPEVILVTVGERAPRPPGRAAPAARRGRARWPRRRRARPGRAARSRPRRCAPRTRSPGSSCRSRRGRPARRCGPGRPSGPIYRPACGARRRIWCGPRGRPGSHPRPPERRPARGRPARGRAAPRAGRRRLGQDPGHRPPDRPPDPRAGHRALARAGRHLHQQGGRRDAGAARRPARPRGGRRLGRRPSTPSGPASCGGRRRGPGCRRPSPSTTTTTRSGW